ncbi:MULTISPECIES: hypothetical protein [unclassified Moraxella]|uniref:hypothetical protein n=1 Tax=unclassified Moraxella TaxID=2685852 RepID=UPI003AF7B3AE
MSAIKYVLLSATLVLTACQKSPDATTEAPTPPKPKTASTVVSEVPTASTTGATVIVAETPATLPPPPIEIQQLGVPVYVEGTPALLHPIITLLQDSKGIIALKSTSDSTDKSDTNYRNDIISAYFNKIGLFDFQTDIDNLVFENITNAKTQRLFGQNTYKIHRVFFPYIAEDNRYFDTNKSYTPKNTPAPTQQTAQSSAQTASTPASTPQPTQPTKPTSVNQKFTTKMLEVDGVKYLALPRVIYEVNEAGKSSSSEKNAQEKMALYMSDNFGQGITRLHPAEQFLTNTEWVEALQRFYFITQADSDGNGIINDKDQTYHYYVDFTPNMPVIHNYRY